MNKLLERRLIDMTVEINIPVRIYEKYGTPEYWKHLERDLNYEIRDIQEFIGDHRSRDNYDIGIKRVYNEVCKFCGYEYPDGYDGIVDCCDKAIKEQEDRIKNLLEE